MRHPRGKGDLVCDCARTSIMSSSEFLPLKISVQIQIFVHLLRHITCSRFTLRWRRKGGKWDKISAAKIRGRTLRPETRPRTELRLLTPSTRKYFAPKRKVRTSTSVSAKKNASEKNIFHGTTRTEQVNVYCINFNIDLGAKSAGLERRLSCNVPRADELCGEKSQKGQGSSNCDSVLSASGCTCTCICICFSLPRMTRYFKIMIYN